MVKQFTMLKVKNAGDKHYTEKEQIFDLPMKLLISGRSQLSGKSTIILNLLLLDQWYNKDFDGDHIWLVSPSVKVDQKLKTLIEEKEIPPMNIMRGYDEEVLAALYRMIEEQFQDAKEAGTKIPNFLVIFDDVSFSGAFKKQNHGAINKLFCNGRHCNISTICTAQKYTDFHTTMRENCTGAIIFSCTDKQLESIAEDHNYLEGGKKAFRKMFREVTNESKHSFLVVNYSNPKETRYLDSEFDPIPLDEDL